MGVENTIPSHDFLYKLVDRWNVEYTPTCDTKSAQNMITWIAAAIHVHDIIFKRGIANGYVSIGQAETTKVKERVQSLLDNLPEWFLPHLKLEQVRDSAKEITLALKGGKKPSTIIFGHGGEKFGRGTTFHRTTLDEFAFQRNAQKIWEAMKGRCIYLNAFSTPAYSKAVYMYFVWSGGIEGVDCSVIHYSENPDKKPGTEAGDKWASRMKIGITEETWRREQECEWISEGGLVYKEFSRSSHVVDPIAIDPNWEFFRGTDFGWEHPFVTLWVARWKCGSWYRWYIFHELYKSNAYLSDLATEIKAVDNKPRSLPNNSNATQWKLHGKYSRLISDAAGKREREELRKLGLPTIPCKKGHDSVNTKINLVRDALLTKPDGMPGLIVSKECVKTIFEFENYMYPKEILDGEHGDKPLPKHDHAMDVIGDILITVGTEEKRRGNITFAY